MAAVAHQGRIQLLHKHMYSTNVHTYVHKYIRTYVCIARMYVLTYVYSKWSRGRPHTTLYCRTDPPQVVLKCAVLLINSCSKLTPDIWELTVYHQEGISRGKSVMDAKKLDIHGKQILVVPAKWELKVAAILCANISQCFFKP